MVFQERTYSVLLVSAGEKFAKTLTELLPPARFWPVTAVKSADEARRVRLSGGYDVVLINTPLPDELGVQLAIDLCAHSDAGVQLLVRTELFQEVYDKVTEYGVLTLAKPTSTPMLVQSLRTLCAVRERLRRAEARQATVEEKIQEIRLVNRAKWALIQGQGMSEEQAHRYIEKQAMDTRSSRREVAARIVEECG